MRNGFKNPAGAFVVVGLMGCPLWVWARRWIHGVIWTSWAVGTPLVAGRLLGAAVEVWILRAHLRAILLEDAESRKAK